MTAPQGEEFLLLAASLLDSLPSLTTNADAVLLQLHVLFGPMLLSALQLVDRREVVLIELPTGRSLYQVTSSTGKPYTLHLSLPSPLPADEKAQSSKNAAGATAPQQRAVGEADSAGPLTPSNAETANQAMPQSRTAEIPPPAEARAATRQRVSRLKQQMEKAYCPCTGFMYNSLGGEKSILCKHLLAVLIVHHSRRLVRAEVQLPAVVSLLDLGAR